MSSKITQKERKSLFTKKEVDFFKKKRQEHIDYVSDLWKEIALFIEENAILKKENSSLKKRLNLKK